MNSLGKERSFWTFFRTNSISVPDFNCNKWKDAVWSATKRGPRIGEGFHEIVFHLHEHESQAERLRKQMGPGMIGQLTWEGTGGKAQRRKVHSRAVEVLYLQNLKE